MAGPPVEVQVRVNTGGSVAGSVSSWKVISPRIETWPVGEKKTSYTCGKALIPPPAGSVMLSSTTRIILIHKLSLQ